MVEGKVEREGYRGRNEKGAKEGFWPQIPWKTVYDPGLRDVVVTKIADAEDLLRYSSEMEENYLTGKAWRRGRHRSVLKPKPTSVQAA